jgi:PAS domain S-box-containing protein
MLFVKDAKDLRFVRWNKAGEDLVGFKREELIGKNDYDFFPKEEADAFTANDREVLEGGILVDISEEPINTAKQGLRLLHTRKVPIMDAEGKPRYLLGISEDITGQKRIEAQLENRVLQLNFLSEIGRKAEQTTSIPEFLQWICQRIPSVMRHETLCVVAITLDNDVYGDAQAIDLPRQIVQGLRIGGERVGRIYIAYTEDHSFADEESALLGSIGQRVANYIETQRLTARARLLAAIVENHPDFIGVGALDGKALYVNPAGLQMAGYAPDLHVEGMNVTQFYPSSDAEVLLNEGMPAALAGGGWSNQAALLRADGSTLHIEETIGVNYDDAGNAVSFSITIRDITERLLTSEAMTKQARELQVVAEVGTAAAVADDAKELLQAVVDLTQNGFGLYFSQVFLLDEIREELYLVAGAGDIGQFLVEEDSRVDLRSRKSLAAEVIRSRAGAITFDVRESPDYLPHPLLPDVKSELAVPLVVGGRVLGVLNAQADEIGYFTLADLPMYMTLATQVAVALQNVYQYEQAQQALAELQMLQRSMTRDGWHSFMTARERPIIGYRAKLDEVEVVMSGMDVATAFSTPVNILGTSIGMMGVQDALSPENESLVQSISVQVGQALERARLAEQTQLALSQTEEQAVRLTQLNEMAAAISAAPTLGEVLQVAAERTNVIFAGQHASLTLLNEEETVLQVYSLTGESGAIDTGAHLPVAETAVGMAVQENRAIVLNDLTQSTSIDVKQLYSSGMRSMMTAPLATSHVIGTLNIASTKPNAFGQNDENLLVQVASLVATTIESRRLFNEVEERAEELAVINEVAQAVSQQLEPIQLLETVFETVQRAILVNAFMVTSYDPTTNLVNYLFVYDDGQRYEVPVAPLNPKSQAYQVIQTGQPILQNYTPDELVALQEQSIVTVGDNRLPASAMFVPLILGTQVTGVLSVQNYEFDVYDDGDVALLAGIANYVAVALENARLFTEVQRRAERERLVNEITRKIQGTTSMESALQTAVHELGSALQAKNAQIALLGKQQTAVQPQTNGEQTAAAD